MLPGVLLTAPFLRTASALLLTFILSFNVLADLRGGDEDQWKYLFSQKMSALQKVIVEASPDLFKQLQSFLSKQSIANATAIQAVIVPSNNYKDKVSTHEIDIFCSNRYAHNSSLSRQSKQRAFCSLNSQHRRFAGADQLFNQSVSSAVYPKSSDDSGGGDKTGVWRVAVPAMSFSQLSGEIKNEDTSTVRLVAIDLDEKDTDFQVRLSFFLLFDTLHSICFNIA
jgi:hypothetical protein